MNRITESEKTINKGLEELEDLLSENHKDNRNDLAQFEIKMSNLNEATTRLQSYFELYRNDIKDALSVLKEDQDKVLSEAYNNNLAFQKVVTDMNQACQESIQAISEKFDVLSNEANSHKSLFAEKNFDIFQTCSNLNDNFNTFSKQMNDIWLTKLTENDQKWLQLQKHAQTTLESLETVLSNLVFYSSKNYADIKQNLLMLSQKQKLLAMNISEYFETQEAQNELIIHYDLGRENLIREMKENKILRKQNNELKKENDTLIHLLKKFTLLCEENDLIHN